MNANPLKTCNTCGRKYMSPEDFLNNTTRWRVCESGHLWFNCACNSTNMIIKGKYDWYNPNKQLSGTAQSVFNQIPNMKDLPRIPSYVMEIQTLIQDENTSATKLAAVAKRDPLLATQVLKIANNLVSARGTKIESLAHAITFIGINALKDIVLVAALKTFKLNSKVFDADHFWEHSFLVGRAAEFLGKRFKLDLLPDEIYIAGSVCNIGKIVLAMCLPDVADRYATELNDLAKLGTWMDAETRNGGFQHTVLGEIGAMFWGLPEHVTEAIAYHHKIPVMNDAMPITLAEVVGLANQIGHWIQLEPNKMDEKLYKAFCARFRLSQQAAEKLVDEMMVLRSAA
ncbi:MAG TPA: HDOD domain-containing protein [Oligoflexus sp.]|uniref:HDOD domain-containing protein n=1 Tax=Oligoflexus sp. TaxID=1971216 RepID=UPI002D3E90BC|nr:HDOD domain-containing protein [Oligoflexus sp.]HYX34660.1 HDOD domain-containing protein [Oligoflexus sp.]